MKKFIPIIACICCALLIGATAVKSQNEGVEYELNSNWKLVHRSSALGELILEFIPDGDDIDNWKELFTYQNGGLGRGQHTPEEQLNSIKAIREKECPGATDWNVIERNENSILYEWYAKPCMGWPEQHEIARIIHGKHNSFTLHYAAKVHELAPETRTQWIKMLDGAKLSSNVNPLHELGPSEDVDEVVPFEMDKIMTALKPAMESVDCKVTEMTASRIECKRPRVFADFQHAGSGGESITAVLEAKGDQTRVRITTGKGFYGRLVKSNWSTPVYQLMMKALRKPPS
jgi:hypothetical protein